MKSLIYFSFLKFTNNLHILFADRVIFEVIEFSGIITEIQQIDLTFVLLVELLYVILDIEIRAECYQYYCAYVTILSVNSFFDC